MSKKNKRAIGRSLNERYAREPSREELGAVIGTVVAPEIPRLLETLSEADRETASVVVDLHADIGFRAMTRAALAAHIEGLGDEAAKLQRYVTEVDAIAANRIPVLLVDHRPKDGVVLALGSVERS